MPDNVVAISAVCKVLRSKRDSSVIVLQGDNVSVGLLASKWFSGLFIFKPDLSPRKVFL